MTFTFNADEIFEIAEQIERNGAAFYRNAADIFSESDIREKLLGLAAMEDAHEKRFASMRDEIMPADSAGFTFDPDNQAALYLQAVADGKIFDLSVPPSEFLRDDVSVIEVLDFAVSLEKDSVVFYNGIKEVVPDDLGKKHIDSIIIEEIGHITFLRAQIDELEQ